MQIKVCDVGTQRPPLHELLGGGERWSGGTHTKKPQRRERLTSRLPPLFMCNLFALSASASLPSAPAGLLPPPVTLPGSLPSGPRALGPKWTDCHEGQEEDLRSGEVVRAGDPSFHGNRKGLQPSEQACACGCAHPCVALFSFEGRTVGSHIFFHGEKNGSVSGQGAHVDTVLTHAPATLTVVEHIALALLCTLLHSQKKKIIKGACDGTTAARPDRLRPVPSKSPWRLFSTRPPSYLPLHTQQQTPSKNVDRAEILDAGFIICYSLMMANWTCGLLSAMVNAKIRLVNSSWVVNNLGRTYSEHAGHEEPVHEVIPNSTPTRSPGGHWLDRFTLLRLCIWLSGCHGPRHRDSFRTVRVCVQHGGHAYLCVYLCGAFHLIYSTWAAWTKPNQFMTDHNLKMTFSHSQ